MPSQKGCLVFKCLFISLLGIMLAWVNPSKQMIHLHWRPLRWRQLLHKFKLVLFSKWFSHKSDQVYFLTNVILWCVLIKGSVNLVITKSPSQTWTCLKAHHMGTTALCVGPPSETVLAIFRQKCHCQVFGDTHNQRDMQGPCSCPDVTAGTVLHLLKIQLHINVTWLCYWCPFSWDL